MGALRAMPRDRTRARAAIRRRVAEAELRGDVRELPALAVVARLDLGDRGRFRLEAQARDAEPEAHAVDLGDPEKLGGRGGGGVSTRGGRAWNWRAPFL